MEKYNEENKKLLKMKKTIKKKYKAMYEEPNAFKDLLKKSSTTSKKKVEDKKDNKKKKQSKDEE